MRNPIASVTVATGMRQIGEPARDLPISGESHQVGEILIAMGAE
jgi:hypothetical protein